MIFLILGQILLFTVSNIKTKIGPVGNMLATTGIYFLSLLYCSETYLINLNFILAFVILLLQGLYIFLYSGLYKSISVKIILEFQTFNEIGEKKIKENMKFDEMFINRIDALGKNGYFIFEGQEFTLSKKGNYISNIYSSLRRIFLSRHEI